MKTIIGNYYDFPDIFKGDTFIARQIKVEDKDGNPPVNSLINVKIKFRLDSKTGTEVLSFENGSGVAITDAANWELTFLKFTNTLNAGTYFYDIETTDSASDVLTIFEGKMVSIQDVTY